VRFKLTHSPSNADDDILCSELIDLADAMRDWGADYGGEETINHKQQVLKIKQWHIRLFRKRFYFVGTVFISPTKLRSNLHHSIMLVTLQRI
jgi:hypothetical protein